MCKYVKERIHIKEDQKSEREQRIPLKFEWGIILKAKRKRNIQNDKEGQWIATNKQMAKYNEVEFHPKHSKQVCE